MRLTTHHLLKRVISTVLLLSVALSAFGCTDEEKNSSTGDAGDNVYNEVPASASPTDFQTLSPECDIQDDDMVIKDDDFYIGPVEQSDFNESVVYANEIANKIQAKYTDGGRTAYEVKNNDTVLNETIYSSEKIGTTLSNKDGNSYFKDTLDVYAIDSSGDEYSVSSYLSNGKINTTKLGYYYYDVNVRDLYMGYSGGVSYPADAGINLTPSSWGVYNMSAPYIDSDGNFSVKVTDSYDPYFYLNGLSIDGKAANAVEITLKTDGDSGNCAVYFYTSDKDGFNAEQMTSFDLKNDGEFHTYVVLLGNYEKNIAGIRFDLGTKAGEKVTVKSARFAYSKTLKVPVAVEKTFHSYPDKIHFEASVLSTDSVLPVKDIKEYGYKVSFDKSSVVSSVIKNSGVSETLFSGKTYTSPEYVAFDIKDAGVVGFIIPNDGSSYRLKLSEDSSSYTLYVYLKNSSWIKFGKPVSISSRIYNDSAHSFEGIAEAAKIERNPFSGITVKSSRKGKFTGYDYATGAYMFSVDGTDFSTAYKKSRRNVYYSADISITSSDDRVIYISMKTDSGALEGAAITNKDGVALPIPIEVCKNFKGEIEEPLYDPQDDAWGYSILPLKTTKNKVYKFSLYHLYQNWGEFPIKQLSSICFHVSYYHLSTGVSESNCIAPYYVYGRDGWVLPDFRGFSSTMWDSQPQYNSVGRLYFTRHEDTEGKTVNSEYTGSQINSSGNTYVDVDYSYISDDGSYEYTLTHFELPQTDENRVFYTLSLKFLKDTSFTDLKKELELFTFDGREIVFENASYLAEDNTKQVIKNKNTENSCDIYVLGKDTPYFSYYGFDISESSFGQNFGLIVRDSYITVDGREWDGNFVFKNEFDGSLNVGSLSLNEENITFSKDDVIELQLILLPYGLGTDTDSDNVDKVIEDSLTHKFTLIAEKGEVKDDYLLPSVKCVDNEAIVTVSGGRNNQTVKAVGYTVLGNPEIYEKIDGEWTLYDFHVKGDYDGYTVQYEDGAYSYSFVCDMGDAPENAERTFKIVVK
ncbi:MAG: hypothetical protein IJZ94_01290 [Clostridia bacterium]|nr:hypothetical protein [Clostridia bacterium]